MKNELQNTAPALPVQTTQGVTQISHEGMQVGHADNVVTNNTFIFANNTPREIETINHITNSGGLDRNYYNFIVHNDFDLSSEYITMEKDRALTGYMTQTVKSIFTPLTIKIVNQIKCMPTIFANENHGYGTTSDDQIALYGFITDIRETQKGYRIYFKVLNQIPQIGLNALADELDFGLSTKFNGLNRTHWAIKNINLIGTLKSAGISVFSI